MNVENLINQIANRLMVERGTQQKRDNNNTTLTLEQTLTEMQSFDWKNMQLLQLLSSLQETTGAKRAIGKAIESTIDHCSRNLETIQEIANINLINLEKLPEPEDDVVVADDGGDDDEEFELFPEFMDDEWEDEDFTDFADLADFADLFIDTDWT